jgi:molybdopterin molybdotransferase
MRPYSRPLTRGVLTHGISSPPGRRQFLRASYDVGASRAVAAVTPVGGAGSHLIGDLAQANALVVVPEEVTAVAAGEQVELLRLDEEF